MKWKPISGETTGNLAQPHLGAERQYVYLNLGCHYGPPRAPARLLYTSSTCFPGFLVGSSVALFLHGGRCCIVCAFCLLHLESWLCLETGNRLLVRVSQPPDGRGDVQGRLPLGMPLTTPCHPLTPPPLLSEVPMDKEPLSPSTV